MFGFVSEILTILPIAVIPLDDLARFSPVNPNQDSRPVSGRCLYWAPFHHHISGGRASVS